MLQEYGDIQKFVTRLKAERLSTLRLKAQQKKNHLWQQLGGLETTHALNGILCCASHIAFYYGYPCSLYDRLIRFKGPTIDGRSITVPRAMPLQDDVMEWCSKVVHELGCDSPNQYNVIYMHHFTLSTLYDSYVVDCSAEDKHVCSESHFRNTWRKLFDPKHKEYAQMHPDPHTRKRVKFRGDTTVGQRKCKTCQDHQLNYSIAKSIEEKKRLNDCFMRHVNWVRTQRRAYYKIQEDARSGVLLSVGIDATSSYATRLPICPKGAAASWFKNKKVDHKVTMAVCHGSHSKDEYHYRVASPSWIVGGGNLQISLFLKCILPVLIAGFKMSFPDKFLPRVLHLQVDRGSDMFNKTWLGVFATLIETKAWFSKIVISALPVGHTHDDYDRSGAYMLRRLCKQGSGALSAAALLKELNDMKNSAGAELKDAWDFNSWLSECIDDRITHHRDALRWIIERDESGNAIWTYFGDCHEEAEGRRWGRVLKFLPDERGPVTASRWLSDSGSIENIGQRRIKQRDCVSNATKLKEIIEGFDDVKLSAFGYVGKQNRDSAIAEWNTYIRDAKNLSPTLKDWPPTVYSMLENEFSVPKTLVQLAHPRQHEQQPILRPPPSSIPAGPAALASTTALVPQVALRSACELGGITVDVAPPAALSN